MILTNVTMPNIPELFDLIQQSSACHLKHASILRKQLENNDESFPQIYHCLQHAFNTNFKEKNIYIERIINFLAVLASLLKGKSEDDIEIHPVLKKLFDFILELSTSSNDSHRYWSSLSFNRIFQDLEEITDDLYEDVKESMLDRLKDPKAAIRCQAIIALHRLQDPTDDNDPVIDQFCNILDSDFNAKVRQLCLEKIALNKCVMPHIINRIRDVDPHVRLTAFEKVSPIAKFLKVTEKRMILQSGFFDLSEKIKKFVSSNLVKNWLESYDNNYLYLMKSIRLDACEEDIYATTHFNESLLNSLFKSATLEEIFSNIKLNENKLINYENLNWETILFYRIAIQYLRQCDEFEAYLLKLLPELVDFCKYIKGYTEFMKQKIGYNNLEYQFTLQQLFLITQGFDVSDTSSRQCLNALIYNILHDELLTPDTAEIIVKNLEKTIPNINDLSNFICEMISNLIYGDDIIDYDELRHREEEKSLQISQLMSDILTLQDQEKHLVFVEKNFAEAERVKKEVEDKHQALQNLKTIQDVPEDMEKKTDFETMSRCLTIAEALLRSPTLKHFNPAISTLNTEIINEALMHDDDRIKVKALKCYALLCVIDQKTARYGIHLFSGLIFAAESELEVLKISLKVTIDLLTIYGLTLVEKSDEEEHSDSRREDERKIFVGGTSLTDLIQALADYLEHEEPEIQSIATKGICVLLLNSRITSPSLLSRIIIKWANPATDSEKLKQFIGLTLSDLVKLPNCYLYFPDAVISTIRTLAYAPKNSALNDIDADNVIKFMVTLCQMPAQRGQIHTEIALKMCHQMYDKPRTKICFLFSKTLALLTVPKGDSQDELLAICDDLKDVIRDSQIIKNVTKFTSSLTKNNVALAPVEEVAIEE